MVNGTCGAKHATLTIPNPFDAAYDYEDDTVCGHAPAGAQPRVDLWGYGTQTPTADGTTHYCVTFGGNPGIETEGESRLDLVSGHSVLHRVRTPTPALWLNKWSDGQPPAGGYHRYTLRVGNDERADMTATGVTLTDDTARRHDLRERRPRPNPTWRGTRSPGTWIRSPGGRSVTSP